MNKPKIIASFIFIAAILGVVFLLGQQLMFNKEKAIEVLKFQPNKGDNWHYKVVSEVTSKRTISNLPEGILEKLTSPKDVKLLNQFSFTAQVEQSDRPITLVLTYESISIEMEVDGRNVEPSTFASIQEMVGKSVYVSMLPEDGSVAAEYSQFSENLLPFAKNLLNLAKFFDDFTLRPIQTGGSWQTKRTNDLAPIGTLKTIQTVKSNYLLKRLTNIDQYACAEVEKTAEITQDASGSEGNVLVEGKGEGGSRAIIHFDMEDGKLIDLHETNSVKMNFNITGDTVDGGKIVSDAIEKVSISITSGD